MPASPLEHLVTVLFMVDPLPAPSLEQAHHVACTWPSRKAGGFQPTEGPLLLAWCSLGASRVAQGRRQQESTTQVLSEGWGSKLNLKHFFLSRLLFPLSSSSWPLALTLPVTLKDSMASGCPWARPSSSPVMATTVSTLSYRAVSLTVTTYVPSQEFQGDI